MTKPSLDYKVEFDINDLLGAEGLELRDKTLKAFEAYLDALETLHKHVNRRALDHTLIQCEITIHTNDEEPGK